MVHSTVGIGEFADSSAARSSSFMGVKGDSSNELPHAIDWENGISLTSTIPVSHNGNALRRLRREGVSTTPTGTILLLDEAAPQQCTINTDAPGRHRLQQPDFIAV